MKNILKYTALLLVGAVSCTGLENDLQKGAADGKVKIEVSATISGQDKATKTHMGTLNGDIYPILWSEGDKIGLIESASRIVDVTLTGGAGTNKGTFGGNVEDLVAPFTGTAIYPAGYPGEDAFADASDMSEGILVGSYLPVKQTFKDGSFDDFIYPMAAVSADGFVYDFYNLGAVIQLKFIATDENQAIRAIYLTGNDDEVIAGGVGMYFDPSTLKPVASTLAKDGPYSEGDYDARLKTVTYGSEEYTRVIVDFQGGKLELSETDTTYVNIAVLPQTFEHGFTVEVVDAGNLGSTYYEAQDNITLARSCVKSMTTIAYMQGDPIDIANSYIFSDSGYYIMPAYAMGNRLDLGLITNEATTGLAADLLWSDVVKEGCPIHTTDRDWLKPAVTNVEYISFTDGKGMLQFKVNIDPDTGEPYRGNAAIALYEKDTKKILWSWHVWMCEDIHDIVVNGYCDGGSYVCQYPDGSEYNYHAEPSDNGNMIIMDRNLGAISANRADGWKTYGLYYQNGRRDPFIGGHFDGNNTDRSNLTTLSGGEEYIVVGSIKQYETTPFGEATAPTWHNAELAPNGWNYVNAFIDVSTALAHPLDFSSGVNDKVINNGSAQWTYYKFDDNKSWLDNTVKGLDGSYPTTGTHGTTGLSDGDHESYWNRTKTIMDPCPVGYSVLGSGERRLEVNSDAQVALSNMNPTFYHSDTDGYGLETSWTYGGTTYTCWWPAAGVRTFYGELAEVGNCGLYFYYDHIEDAHGGHGMAFYLTKVATKGKDDPVAAGTIYTSKGIISNHACSVRCVREKQFNDLTKYPLR